jgi:hypothetical protein
MFLIEVYNGRNRFLGYTVGYTEDSEDELDCDLIYYPRPSKRIMISSIEEARKICRNIKRDFPNVNLMIRDVDSNAICEIYALKVVKNKK